MNDDEQKIPMPKHVLFYEPADDVLAKAPAHFPAHSERCDMFHERGSLLMVGTFGDPQQQGPMAVFTMREATEEFVSADPFVLNPPGENRDHGAHEVEHRVGPIVA